jgi:protein O-mannosyl-transferase
MSHTHKINFRTVLSSDQPAWSVPLLILIACLFVYANSFMNGFLLDDHVVLFGQKGVENKAFLEIFTTNHGDYYRPLAQALLWIFYHLFGKNVIGYHVGNLAVLWFCAWLFFVIVLRLSGNRALALLTAVLYAIHPAQAYFVNYTGSTGLLLTTIGTQLAFLAFMEAVEKEDRRFYILSIGFMGLTFLTHETALILPVPIAAWLFFIRGERPLKIAGRVWPYLVLSAVYFFFRSKLTTSLQFSNGFANALHDPVVLFATWMDLLGWYFSKLVFPHHMMFLRSEIFCANYVPGKVVLFAAVLALVVYLLAFRWRRGLRAFALSVFLLGLLPSWVACFSFYPIVRPYIEPHWFSFCSIGYFMLVAGLLLAFLERRRVWGGLVMGAVLIGLAALMWNYNARFRTEEGFCRYWLSLDGGNITPYWGLGRSRLEAGDFRGAAEIFVRGHMTLKAFHPFLLADAGHCFDELNEDQNAFMYLYAAVHMDPQYALAYHYSGLFYMKRNDWPAAEILFRKSIELDPRGSLSRPYLKSVQQHKQLTGADQPDQRRKIILPSGERALPSLF